jgi:hypothetical protein
LPLARAIQLDFQTLTLGRCVAELALEVSAVGRCLVPLLEGGGAFGLRLCQLRLSRVERSLQLLRRIQ